MMGLIIRCLCLTLWWLHSGWSADVVQRPPLWLAEIGQTVPLNCSHEDSIFLTKYWYRKKDRAIDLIGYSYNAGEPDMEKAFPKEKMTMVPDTPKRTTLHIYDLSVQDSAIYYCASSRVSNQKQEFGSGTVLSVLEKDETIKGPKVSIYRPSKQELEDHSFISLVCVASNFFPEHVKIRWFVNNEERINLYEPVAQKKSDNTYSTSKRLTLTRSEYFSPDSEFRCEAAFLDGTEQASAKIKGETDCGVSKETYTSSINVGKVSYIMVLCKSGLYALVVLVLVWRKKVIASSY